MAHEELLAWSAGRLPWQQDALRRLATQGELTADDLLALRLQIEQAAGLPVKDAPDPMPLAEEHLNQAASNNPRTVLASLGPVRHVDRLSPDQPPLRFAINGITLVYGANASGKSGYCRIARQLCRSLSPVDLRGNVYDAGAPAPPEVDVAFRIGGDDQPKEELTWYSDQDPPAELSRISVFDTASARVYVDRQRKIEFLPYELDLMNKLGLACRSLEEGFKERLTAVNAALSTRLPEAYHEGTTVQATLARLVTQTALEDLPREPELRAFGSWSAEKQAAFDTAGQHLRQDPQVMIRLRSEAKQALETVKAETSAIEEELADPSLTAIQRKRRDAENASRAVEAAARDLFSDQPIPDLGSETWRLMLTYAREFSVTVFPDAPPPQLANGGLCVLCQQDLDDNAVHRMSAFDDYIAGRAAEESVAADKILAEHRDRLLAFRVRPQREVEVLLAGYAGLSDASKEAALAIATFVEKAGVRLEAVKGALRDNRYDPLHDLDPLPDSPAQFIEDEIGRLETEISQLEVAERNEGALARLKARHAEFADQKRLSEQIQIVIERRNRLEERHRLEICAQQCRSTAITRRITDRRREILTPTLRAALQQELERLRLTHIPSTRRRAFDAAGGKRDLWVHAAALPLVAEKTIDIEAFGSPRAREKRWLIEEYFGDLKVGTRIKERKLNLADDLRKCLAIDAVTACARCRTHCTHGRPHGRDQGSGRSHVQAEPPEAARPARPEPDDREFRGQHSPLAGFIPGKRQPLPRTKKLWEGYMLLSSFVEDFRAWREYGMI